MINLTTNHGFKMPDYSELLDIKDVNDNMIKIDNILVSASETKDGLLSALDKKKINEFHSSSSSDVDSWMIWINNPLDFDIIKA